MALKIYNTLSRSVEPFKSITPEKVGMYVCGVTVYDDCHIGHGRTFIAFDVARRWLQESGYDVKFVRNVTDVDDKIIKRAAERKILRPNWPRPIPSVCRKISVNSAACSER